MSSFLAWVLASAVAYWMIFLDGADLVANSWWTLLFGDRPGLDATELKFMTAIAWIVSCIMLLVAVFA